MTHSHSAAGHGSEDGAQASGHWHGNTAGNPDSLADVADDPPYEFVHGDTA